MVCQLCRYLAAAIDFLIAATVLSVRNCTIFRPFSIVFSTGVRLTPLIVNLPALMRSGSADAVQVVHAR